MPWNESNDGEVRVPDGRNEPRSSGWPVTWTAQRDDQLARALAATPAQRLAWLEEAIALAFRSGALPKDDGAAVSDARPPYSPIA